MAFQHRQLISCFFPFLLGRAIRPQSSAAVVCAPLASISHQQRRNSVGGGKSQGV